MFKIKILIEKGRIYSEYEFVDWKLPPPTYNILDV